MNRNLMKGLLTIASTTFLACSLSVQAEPLRYQMLNELKLGKNRVPSVINLLQSQSRSLVNLNIPTNVSTQTCKSHVNELQQIHRFITKDLFYAMSRSAGQTMNEAAFPATEWNVRDVLRNDGQALGVAYTVALGSIFVRTAVDQQPQRMALVCDDNLFVLSEQLIPYTFADLTDYFVKTYGLNPMYNGNYDAEPKIRTAGNISFCAPNQGGLICKILRSRQGAQ